MKIKKYAIISVFICFIFILFERFEAHAMPYGVATNMAKHFDFASHKYEVPKELLMAIAKTESNFNPWAINIQGKGYHLKNKVEALALAQKAFAMGKSFDVGIMQINVWWLKKYKIALETAIEPQNNVILGAFVLKHEIMRHGLNWKAVASYHTPLSRNPERGRRYAALVIRKLKTIQKTKNDKGEI